MVIEIEVRSFITKDKYEEIIKYFTEKAKFVREEDQETHYFDSEVDFRIQKTID